MESLAVLPEEIFCQFNYAVKMALKYIRQEFKKMK
jgi:hypothetical protein